MGKELIDLSTINLEDSVVPLERIRDYLPQRGEFEMVDGVCHVDTERGICVAWKDLTEDAWWARAHFPGDPLMPGVLLTEAAAQVATILWKEIAATPNVIGLTGLDRIRFRGKVVPPARLYLVATVEDPQRLQRRMAGFPCQAFVEGSMVFEGTILGVAL